MAAPPAQAVEAPVPFDLPLASRHPNPIPQPSPSALESIAEWGSDCNGPIVVIPDLHGHLQMFEAALAHGLERAKAYSERNSLDPTAYPTVVTLGDYTDNGPEVLPLIQRLKELRDEGNGEEAVAKRGYHYRPILGNHDAGLLLSHRDGVFHSRVPPKEWFTNWNHYHVPWETPTPKQYAEGAKGGDGGEPPTGECTGFMRDVNVDHAAFLMDLPWFWRIGPWLFVHAGLHTEEVYPTQPQLDFLRKKDLSFYQTPRLPDQLRMKAERKGDFPPLSDSAWGAVVVTGHNKYPKALHQVGSHRLGLHSGTCQAQALHCVVLPPTLPEGHLPLPGFAPGGPPKGAAKCIPLDALVQEGLGPAFEFYSIAPSHPTVDGVEEGRQYHSRPDTH